MPTFADIAAARERLRTVVPPTPISTCATIDALAGRSLVFKCEHLQKVGAFKFRGAWNAVSKLSDAEAARGVVTHSSGNHAQALALAAKMRGIPAYIVMPKNAPVVKRAAVVGYGATVIDCEPTLAARESECACVQSETGATLIHPFDNADVIAGQGTACVELLEQAPDLDAIVTPVGGGGLLSGTCLAAAHLKPGLRVLAAEPLGADDAARSFRAGAWQPQTSPNTIADGLKTSLGELTWPIIRQHVERIVTVRENEIVSAMRLAWERAKLLIEPSAAVALAAVLTPEFRDLPRPRLRRVGVILSGGNVDLDRLPWMK
jgi:threonine dehydratase/serine racemase